MENHRLPKFGALCTDGLDFSATVVRVACGDEPSQQNCGMGPSKNSPRQEAHVSPFHLHTGRQAFPGHCSRGLPRRRFRPPAKWGWRWPSSSRPGFCVLPVPAGPWPSLRGAGLLPTDRKTREGRFPWVKINTAAPPVFTPVLSGGFLLFCGRPAALGRLTRGSWPS